MALDFDRFCMGCMSCETEEGKPCPICGFDEAAYAPAANVLPLRTILNGKYLLGRAIGQGGFGIIYLGWDLNLDMKLAIKEYYPDGFVTRDCRASSTVAPYSGESEEFFTNGLKKFIDEAKRLAKFYSLPGIVSVRDYFRENGTAYIIMEFIEGQTLKARLEQRGGRMPVRETLEMMRPLMDSLAEVHAHDIIHRDISPDNIMIDKAGHFRLIDFGAAREFGGEGSQTILLKPGYAPYEQYQSRGDQGPWTDLYALCATIYRCVTGEVPPEASMRLPTDTLKPPSSFPGTGMGKRVEEVLLKGLAIFPKDRWQNIKELQTALDTALREDAADEGAKKKTTEKQKRSGKEFFQAFLARVDAIPTPVVGLLVAVSAALLLLVLLVPWPSSDGDGSRNASLPPSSSSGVSLAVPPAGEWEKMFTPSALGDAVQLRQPEDPDAVVKLSDWALEYHLRKAMDKPVGDFTAGELAQIQSLHICDITCTVNAEPPEGSSGYTIRMGNDADVAEVPHVIDLSDLPYFINLRELSLVHQTGGTYNWQTFEPIGELEGLTYLDLTGNRCRYQNLEPLGKLTRLEFLSLEDLYYQSGDSSFSSITDLSFLSGLTGLRVLDLSHNSCRIDLSALAGLTGLETLDLSHMKADAFQDPWASLDLTPLAGLPALQTLDLEFSHVQWDTLAGLTQLRELNLHYTDIRDLSVLEGLTSLEWLDLSKTGVTDLSPVATVKNVIQ